MPNAIKTPTEGLGRGSGTVYWRMDSLAFVFKSRLTGPVGTGGDLSESILGTFFCLSICQLVKLNGGVRGEGFLYLTNRESNREGQKDKNKTKRM
jgi:hypothetical protein